MKQVVASYDLNIKNLAIDIIAQALKDVQTEIYKTETLAWFDRRDVSAMGYGWCLGQSQLNPNMIRTRIKELTKI